MKTNSNLVPTHRGRLKLQEAKKITNKILFSVANKGSLFCETLEGDNEVLLHFTNGNYKCTLHFQEMEGGKK